MDKSKMIPGEYYRVTFPDGQPIDFKFKETNNDSFLCEKKEGETFFLDTVEPFDSLEKISGW